MPEIQTAALQETLRAEGYLNVPFLINGTGINPLFEQFRELSELAWAPDGSGQELLSALRYEIPERPVDASYFAVRRRVGEVNPYESDRAVGTDNKDVVHIGPRSYETAQARLGSKMPAVMREFLGSCVELHEAVKETVRPIFETLHMDDAMLAENPRDDIHLIRVIRYLGTAASHKADLHFDRAVATFAAWESSPGLVGVPGNNAYGSSLTIDELEAMASRANVSPVQHVSGEGKLFLGAGYNHLPSRVHERNGYLPLFAHGVLNETAEEERDAVVVFMNPHLGCEGYTVPAPHETGFDDLQRHLAVEETPQPVTA